MVAMILYRIIYDQLTIEDWNCPFDIVASCTVARPCGGTWLEVDDILLAVEARTENLI